MQHIAIDLGSKESQVCIRAADGQVLQETKVVTRDLSHFLSRQSHSRVILETCSEAFRVADAALNSHHEVRVVPATLVKTLGVGARGIETDRRDAQILSEVSCRIDLPSVHVLTHLARERRTLCGMRDALVTSRTALINNVRGWARTQLLKLRSSHPPSFPKHVRNAASTRSEGLPDYVERLLKAIDSLNEQIADADKQLQHLCQQDPLCQRLMSIPGVGTVTALRFVSAIDDVSRFASAHAVQAFLGLTPGEHSSSQQQRRTGITKAGPGAVRAALVQAARSLRRYRPLDTIPSWAAKIEQRRGKNIATVAVARKLAGVMFAMWRDGTSYEPQHRQKAPSI